jgi:hypothetical protein
MELSLTIILAVTQLVLGGMGVYVSLKPPKQEDHNSWMLAFIVVGFVGVCLTGWLAKASDAAQRQANKDIHDAQVAATDANTAATNANTAATNAATAATNAQRETEAARNEARKANSEVEQLINQRSAETTKTILSWRSDTESAVGKILRPPRILGDRRPMLVSQLRNSGSHEVAITAARGNQECLDFANEIESAFNEAGWKVVPTQQLQFITKEGTGLALLVKGTNDNDLRPDQFAVAKAFYLIGMQLKPMPGKDYRQSGPVELYVGLQ